MFSKSVFFENRHHPQQCKGEGRNGSEIHVPIDCDLMIIDSAKHMEHSSNEEQIGEGRYFGGRVFIAVSRLFNGTNRCNPQATLVKFEHWVPNIDSINSARQRFLMLPCISCSVEGLSVWRREPGENGLRRKLSRGRCGVSSFLCPTNSLRSQRLVQHPASAHRHLVSKRSCPGSVPTDNHLRGVRLSVYRNTIRKSNNADKEMEYEEGWGDGGGRGNKRKGGRKGVLVHPSLFSILVLIQFCVGLTRKRARDNLRTWPRSYTTYEYSAFFSPPSSFLC